MTSLLAVFVASIFAVTFALAEDPSRGNNSLLQVIQCEAELASARLADIRQKPAELKSTAASDENAKNQLATSRAALQQLAEAAEAATAKRNRAELEAAEANLRRQQQQLLNLGVAAKSDVDRAEEKLAELQAQNNQ